MPLFLRSKSLVAALMIGSATPLMAQDDTAVRPAKLITVEERDRVSRLSQPFIVEPNRSAVLTMQVGGVLVELPVDEGTFVKRGELIAQVDKRILENDLSQANAQNIRAIQEYERAERLVGQKTISQATYDQRKTERDLAELAVEAAEKRLSDATLLAPFDGVVALLNVDRFQTVSPQESIVTLQSQDQFVAVVQIPARELANAEDMEVLKAELFLDVAPLTGIPGHFKALAFQADPASQTYRGQVLFDAPETVLVLPGMTGIMHADVIHGVSQPYVEVVEIPVPAILFDGDDTFVWIVDEATMTVSRRNVTVLDEIGSSLAISEGLEKGDVIVGAGASYLHEGMKIRRYEG